MREIKVNRKNVLEILSSTSVSCYTAATRQREAQAGACRATRTRSYLLFSETDNHVSEKRWYILASETAFINNYIRVHTNIAF